MNRAHLSILGYYGYANTGDEAILDCLVSQLKEMDIGFRITVYSGNPEHTSSTYGVEAEPNILPTSLSAWAVRSLGRNRRSFFKAIKTFRQCDIVLVGGGGLFFDSPDTNRFLLEMLHKIRWARRLNKRVVLLGVGFGPIHFEQSRERLRQVLNSVDLIAVRDHDSRELVRQLGIDQPDIHTTGDFVFLLDMADPYRVSEIIKNENLTLSDQPVIGISVCGYHTVMPGFKESIAGFCRYVTRELRARVWFIPMQTGGGIDDRDGARDIVGELENTDGIEIIEGTYTPQESLGLIAQTDAMLTERLHGVILAMMARTPLFGISYMPKVSRLFDEIDHNNWQIKLDEISAESIIKGFARVWDDRVAIEGELDQITADMRKRAMANFMLLRQALAEDIAASDNPQRSD
jgi:polysaccharide pyruvyl transferase CsaB